MLGYMLNDVEKMKKKSNNEGIKKEVGDVKKQIE